MYGAVPTPRCPFSTRTLPPVSSIVRAVPVPPAADGSKRSPLSARSPT